MKNKLYNYITKNNIELDYDVYEYSLLILKRYSIILFLTLSISCFMNILFETIICLITFSILRKFVGGFHFENNMACLIFSVFSSILIPYLAVSIKKFNLLDSYFVLILDLLLTIKIAPVDHINKRITKKEAMIYKKKAICVELIYITILSSTYYLHLNGISNLLILTFNVMSMLLAYFHR